MKLKHLIFPCAVVCMAALSLGVSVTLRRAHAGQAARTALRNIPWAPYQITYKTFNKKADWAEPVLLGESMRAVRSDGSSLESSTTYRLNRTVYDQQRLLQLPGGVRIRTDEQLALMTATRNAEEDGARARQQLDPMRSCAASREGGEINPPPIVTSEMLLGYQTYRIVIDAHRYRNTFWRAPALGCAELRMLGEKMDVHSGLVDETADRTAVEIRAGQPDPTLFELPRGFRNVSPSELAAAHAKACCQATLKDTEVAALQTADEHFRQFRFDW